jgi:peptidoglycan/LPS O-acetylase OafA/YrhL
MPFIAAAKPEGAGLAAWYVALLLASVALGWVVHRVYSEPLNRVLRLRFTGRRVLSPCSETDDRPAHSISKTL